MVVHCKGNYETEVTVSGAKQACRQWDYSINLNHRSAVLVVHSSPGFFVVADVQNGAKERSVNFWIEARQMTYLQLRTLSTSPGEIRSGPFTRYQTP